MEAPPGEVHVDCDEVFGTFEEGKCTLVAWWGTNLELDVQVDTLTRRFQIEGQ